MGRGAWQATVVHGVARDGHHLATKPLPPVFLPGKSHGQRSFTDRSPWGHKRVRLDSETKQQHSIVYMHHIFFIHLSGGHLGCPHVLAIVNRAALNIGEHVSWVFSRYMPQSGIARSRVNIFNFFFFTKPPYSSPSRVTIYGKKLF